MMPDVRLESLYQRLQVSAGMDMYPRWKQVNVMDIGFTGPGPPNKVIYVTLPNCYSIPMQKP